MLALDKKTGEVIWKGVVPNGDNAGYSSIVAANIAGSDDIWRIVQPRVPAGAAPPSGGLGGPAAIAAIRGVMGRRRTRAGGGRGFEFRLGTHHTRDYRQPRGKVLGLG